MTEIEITVDRAIERLEFIRDKELWAVDKLSKAAIKMALTALSEQAERSKGCEYCNGKRPIGSTDGYIEGYWHEGDVGMPYGTTGILEIEITPRDVRHIKINYCPMCGRKLKEDKP